MALYVVTGAAGFIGSHLVDTLLAAGHTVRGIDDLSTGHLENVDPRCHITRADIADPDAVRTVLHRADGVFHLAAIASVCRTNQDWLGTHRTNQTGTITVLDAARELGPIPVVYASSAAVYGDLGNRIADEDMRTLPISAYGADKLGSELHASAAWHVHRVPTLGLRFFNVYGPRQDPTSPYTGVISLFADRIAQGETVTVHGDGLQTRDFVHVADVANHLAAAMRRLHIVAGAEVANVCTGRGTSVLELVRSLGALHGRQPRVIAAGARPGDIRQSIGSTTHARHLLGVEAAITLRTGLKTLIQREVQPA